MHVFTKGWWIRVMLGLIVLSYATLEREQSMSNTIMFGLLVISALVLLPTMRTFIASVETQQILTMGGVMSIIVLVAVVALIVSAMSSKCNNMTQNSTESQRNGLAATVMVDVIAATGVGLMDQTSDNGLSNVLIGSTLLPLVWSANRIGNRIGSGDSPLPQKEDMEGVITTIVGVLMVLFIMVFRLQQRRMQLTIHPPLFHQ